MKTHQQYQLDSLQRVQAFLDANATAVGALQTSEARQQLDAAVAQLVTHGNDQSTAGLELAGQISREKSLITDLKTRHMQPIATFARAKLRGVPDFAALIKPLANESPKQLVQTARAMATAGAPQADALTRGGFPPDTIAQLGAAADAVQAAMTDRSNTKVRRVGATKGIGEQLVLGREAARMLNAVIRKQFGGDATFLAAWRSAWRVTAKPGVARGLAAVPVVAVPSAVTAPAAAAPVVVPQPAQSAVQQAA
jgi:hypothetical protein